MKILKGITASRGGGTINTFARVRTYDKDKESDLVSKAFGNFYNLVDQKCVMLAYNGNLPTLNIIEYNAKQFHQKF